MKQIKTILIAVLSVIALLTAVFLGGRYGWKLFGFQACDTAGIEDIQVEDGQVRLRGFDPGSFPRGFLGYHAEQTDGTLSIGFRFSGIFGFFETGDFDITVPTNGTVTKIVLKSRDHEYVLWPREEEEHAPDVEEPRENGIYIRFQRSDVYSVNWYFENKGGGMMNADGSALETEKSIFRQGLVPAQCKALNGHHIPGTKRSVSR